MVTSCPIEQMVNELRAVVEAAEEWHPITLRSNPRLSGWAGFDLPQRVGGAAWPARQMVSLFRHCGRVDIELRDLIGGGHARLLALESTRRFDPLMQSVAAGEAFCAVALTEPGAGSDLGAIATQAVPQANGYRLDGEKHLVARIEEASHFILFAAVSREPPGSPVTAFVIPRDAPGLAVEAMQPMGLKRVSWGRITLNEVFAPSAARIGGEGRGIALFQRHFSYWRIMMAAAAVGCAEAAVDEATRRMQTRDAFGGPIGRFTHLQQGLAIHVARLRMAWLLIDDVASIIDSAKSARPWPVFDAAMAKAEATEIALGAAEWSMTVFGGAAYDAESTIQKRYRDLSAFRYADGTTDMLRGQVARSVLGERIYELSLNRNKVNNLDDTASRRFW